MSNHGTRFGAGLRVITALAILAATAIFAKLAWDAVIGPNMGIILTGLFVIVAFTTVTYLIGYLVTDLPDDIREWSG